MKSDLTWNDRSQVEASKNEKASLKGPNQKDIEIDLKNLLENISTKSKNCLRENLLRYYGRNYPINYQQQYHFEEQW